VPFELTDGAGDRTIDVGAIGPSPGDLVNLWAADLLGYWTKP
jgi:hypothetical protein